MFLGIPFQIFHFLVSNQPLFISISIFISIFIKHVNLSWWLYHFSKLSRFFSKNARNSTLFDLFWKDLVTLVKNFDLKTDYKQSRPIISVFSHFAMRSDINIFTVWKNNRYSKREMPWKKNTILSFIMI